MSGAQSKTVVGVAVVVGLIAVAITYAILQRNRLPSPGSQRYEHPLDWQVFHTRYVTPGIFEQGLRRFRSDDR